MLQQNTQDPEMTRQGHRVSVGLSRCDAGGLQVSGWTGRDPGGRLCRFGLHGLLFLDWNPLLTDHSAGCAFFGTCSWSWQHLHLCAGVPGERLPYQVVRTQKSPGELRAPPSTSFPHILSWFTHHSEMGEMSSYVLILGKSKFKVPPKSFDHHIIYLTLEIPGSRWLSRTSPKCYHLFHHLNH